MGDQLVVNVTDLVGRVEKRRDVSGIRDLSLRLGDSSVDGPMSVTGSVMGTLDGVQATFEASTTATLTCVRCLTEWKEDTEVSGSQHFSRTPDEDGYAIVEDEIDVGGPATDEIALALPAVPVCREECKGLCPICGTDLNSDPCDGHGDDPDSPFAVLKDLFDS